MLISLVRDTGRKDSVGPMDLSRVDVILVQSGSMLAGFELRAFVVEALVRVFEHVPGKFAVASLQREVGGNVLGFCGTTGLDDIVFPMF